MFNIDMKPQFPAKTSSMALHCLLQWPRTLAPNKMCIKSIMRYVLQVYRTIKPTSDQLNQNLWGYSLGLNLFYLPN
jgi:hypothetical protein